MQPFPLKTDGDKKPIFLSSKISFEKKKTEEFMQKTTLGSTKGFTQTLDSFGDTIKSKSTQNIFDEINNSERKKYVDYYQGPRFDNEGQLVKWTIVGKVSEFVKTQKQKRVQIKKNDDEPSFDEQEKKPIVNAQPSMAISERNANKDARKTPKKNKGEFKKVQGSDQINKMVEIKQRIEKNKKSEHKSLELLPLHQRNILTREKKVIEMFDDQKIQWDFYNNQVAANAERQPNETIFTRSNQFRDKQWKLSAIEAVKSDEEKYNDRQWYMRLRYYDFKDERAPFTLITKIKPQTTPYKSRLQNRYIKDPENERTNNQQAFILSDVYSNFNTKIIDNPYQQVETIITESTTVTPKPLYSRQFFNNYNQKLVGRNGKKRFIECKDPLHIQGVSQFKREIEMLDPNQVYNQIELPKEEPEVIVDVWDRKQLAKSGENFYPKI
ncbi:hypothetical protein pb186bvf_017598 [Paramecium bursaria]